MTLVYDDELADFYAAIEKLGFAERESELVERKSRCAAPVFNRCVER